MPRKLLRVALIAAVIPALTPVVSSAQTARPASTVRTVASTPAVKQQAPSWWQRLRGQKPAATPTTKVVTVSAEKTAPSTAVATEKPFEPAANADAQLPRTRTTRVRPLFGASQSKPVEVQKNQPDVATPVVEAAHEAVAFPIDSAPPPRDVTADYNQPRGQRPRYDYTALQTPAAAPDDVNFANPVPSQPVSLPANGMNGAIPANPVYGGTAGFMRVDGAMYPSPRPGIPMDVGAVMITNPALDPHEMLYAHHYRGLYGPFYHKTYRHWIMTPFGICKSEKRVLMGTEVRVNYKSHISPFSLFFPPVTH